MTTSGTQGQTTIDVTDVIETAFRRCGKLASTVSAELQLGAKRDLYILLSDLANRGLSLWCVEKHVMGVTPGQITYGLPTGTVDLMSTLYRTKTDLTGDAISGAGWEGIDLGAGLDEAVYNAAVQFTSATSATLVLESSDDNVTWTTVQAFTKGSNVPAGTWYAQDSENSPTARYWRVRDTSGTLPGVTTLTFSVSPYEIPMAKMSNDDYVSLPDKSRTVPAGSKSLQYWFDKQIAPRIWIWPGSDGNVDQIVVWTQRHIQDVGALSNTLDIPQRWFESVILQLAVRCAMALPAGELPAGRYELLSMEAEKHLAQAEDGESDGAPIRIAPRIAGYTR